MVFKLICIENAWGRWCWVRVPHGGNNKVGLCLSFFDGHWIWIIRCYGMVKQSHTAESIILENLNMRPRVQDTWEGWCWVRVPHNRDNKVELCLPLFNGHWRCIWGVMVWVKHSHTAKSIRWEKMKGTTGPIMIIMHKPHA